MQPLRSQHGWFRRKPCDILSEFYNSPVLPHSVALNDHQAESWCVLSNRVQRLAHPFPVNIEAIVGSEFVVGKDEDVETKASTLICHTLIMFV